MVLAGLPQEYRNWLVENKKIQLKEKQVLNEEYMTELNKWAQRNRLINMASEELVKSLFADQPQARLMEISNVMIDGEPKKVLVNPYNGRIVRTFPMAVNPSGSGSGDPFNRAYSEALKQAKTTLEQTIKTMSSDEVSIETTASGSTILKVKDQALVPKLAQVYTDQFLRHYQNLTGRSWLQDGTTLPDLPVRIGTSGHSMAIHTVLQGEKNPQPYTYPNIAASVGVDEKGQKFLRFNKFYPDEKFHAIKAFKPTNQEDIYNISSDVYTFLKVFSKEAEQKLTESNVEKTKLGKYLQEAFLNYTRAFPHNATTKDIDTIKSLKPVEVFELFLKGDLNEFTK